MTEASAPIAIDDAAVLWSTPVAERGERPLLVLLHGYNSDETDLFGLAPYLPLEPTIASLRAPLDAGYGYAWFPLAFGEDGRAIEDAGAPDGTGRGGAATAAVLDWVDRLDPVPTSIGLLGFSQGGAIALELLRARPEAFAYAGVLAGFADEGERAGDERLRKLRPPVFWGRGTRDEVIPASAVARTQAWLPEHATLVEGIYEGLGHQLSEAELADLVEFLRRRFRAA